MNRTCPAIFLIMLFGVCLCTAASEWAIPKLPISPPAIAEEDVPLSYAVAKVTSQLRGGHVLFGIEVREVGGKEPTVDLSIAEGETLPEALRTILQQVPGYTVEVLSEHMVNIYPQGAKEDHKNPMNLRVEQFDVVNEWANVVLGDPQVYILKLAKRLVERTTGPPYPIEGPSFTSGSTLHPRVTVRLRDITVREILNAISRATEETFPANLTPLCWASIFHPDPVWAVGGTYSWRLLLCAPEDWKKYWKPAPDAEKKPAAGRKS